MIIKGADVRGLDIRSATLVSTGNINYLVVAGGGGSYAGAESGGGGAGGLLSANSVRVFKSSNNCSTLPPAVLRRRIST